MTNQISAENDTPPAGQKKYYIFLAVYYILILILVAFVGGAVQVYLNRKVGVVVTLAILFAGWVGYKYISRAYHNGELIGPDGEFRNPAQLKAKDKDSEETTPSVPVLDDTQLSAKDKARRAEIERQRKELKKRRKSK